MAGGWRREGTVIKQALLTGVSYMIPFVVAGGILIAIGFAIGGIYVSEGEGFGTDVYEWGQVAMGLMTAALGGYIAFSISDKPGLAPGFVAGMIAATQGSGFLGAMAGGLVAGYLVRYLKRIPLPVSMRSLLPTLVIPVVSVFIIGVIMYYVLGVPVAWLNQTMLNALNNLSGGWLIVLGLVAGAMSAFDMGGPVNKAGYTFALLAADADNWMPMAAIFIAGMSQTLGLFIATFIAKNKFTPAERALRGSLVVGTFALITEFAIPFAVSRPLRIIPSLMCGSAVGAALSYLAGLTLHAPHGGMFVILLANNPLLFLAILLVASCVTAGTLALVLNKRDQGTDSTAAGASPVGLQV
ncbi:MAG: PTS fructose transporter subunit IIC [Microbacterium sp.]